MVQKNTIIYYFQQPVFRKPVISVNFHLQLNWNYDVILKICFSGFSDIFHNYIHYNHTKFRIVIICLKQVTGGSFAWNTALRLLLFVCEYLGLNKCEWSVCVGQVDKNRSEITWITFSDLRTRLVRKKKKNSWAPQEISAYILTKTFLKWKWKVLMKIFRMSDVDILLIFYIFKWKLTWGRNDEPQGGSFWYERPQFCVSGVL